MIDDETKIAKIFNEYFVNIVKKLGLITKEQSAISTENSLNEVEIAITKHQNHPSIIAITEKMEKLGNPSFSFEFTSYEEIVKEVNNQEGFSKSRYSRKNYQGKYRYCFLFPLS